MDGLILFRRPRKIPKSKLSENNNYVYKPRETKISITKNNSASNSHLPISNNIVFSSTGTTINFMNKNKNKRQGDVANFVNNGFGCLFIKGGMLNKTFNEIENASGSHNNNNNNNNNEFQYSIEICNHFQISDHTETTHNLKQLKSINTTGFFSKNNFNDILEIIPKPIKRTPLYHGLILIARELRNAITRTIDTNLICSIEKIPRNFQQSLNNYQVNYAIILKEKLNQNQLIWYEFYDLKSIEQLDLSYNRLVYLDSRIKNLDIGSCCWCGMDRYDQKNTICIHCVDVFKYSTVPICMLCCGIQCVTEVKQCSTSEQFAKRYYKSYENYTNR
ncbi:unnamed protein product [Schistosoma bovis]|nr:unnamed protein product [Schistosoma bovis]